jgi:tryptophanyl-tRNA synthetase
LTSDDQVSKTPEQLGVEEHASKLRKKEEIETYYEGKRLEMNLDSTERIIRYLEDPGPFFHRNIAYAHKDFDKVLSAIAGDKEWAIVSGLNPSGALHFGHKAMFDVLLWFQRTFKARIFLPITNDETYVVNKASSLAESRSNAYDLVIPSIIALGFDPNLTHIFVHSDYPDFFNLAMSFSKYTTYNNVRRLFGWTGSENVGMVFYMGALQMASIIMPQLPEFGGPKPVLVPVGIDQHPYVSLSRDVANRLGLVPPSELIWKFLVGLKGPDNKMSSSVPDSTIFLTDTPAQAAKKIRRAYSGGLSSGEMHRKLGGVPEICSVFSLITFNFLTNDEWDQCLLDYRAGKMMTGELKKLAIEHVSEFLERHRQLREEAKSRVDQFVLTTPMKSILEMAQSPNSIS